MWIVWRAAGAVVAPATLLRVLGALAVAMAIAQLLPVTSALMTLLASGAVAASYVVILVLLGELGKADLGHLRRIAGKAA
jgi:hypothetical protein